MCCKRSDQNIQIHQETHKHCLKQDTTYLAKGLVSQAKIIFPLERQDNRGAVFLGSSDRIHWLRWIHIENTKIVRFMQSLSVCGSLSLETFSDPCIYKFTTAVLE